MQLHPLKFFFAKLVRFEQIWLDLGESWAKFEQNQNLSSPTTRFPSAMRPIIGNFVSFETEDLVFVSPYNNAAINEKGKYCKTHAL